IRNDQRARSRDCRARGIHAKVRRRPLSRHHRHRIVSRWRVARYMDSDQRLVAVQRADSASSSRTRARQHPVIAMRASLGLPLAVITIALAAIVIGLKLLLHLPGVPYNVSELFLDHA